MGLQTSENISFPIYISVVSCFFSLFSTLQPARIFILFIFSYPSFPCTASAEPRGGGPCQCIYSAAPRVSLISQRAMKVSIEFDRAQNCSVYKYHKRLSNPALVAHDESSFVFMESSNSDSRLFFFPFLFRCLNRES